MRVVVLGVLAFTAMEPITALTHRFVMHGIGVALHRSHHRRGSRGWEANDAFPVMFASIVCIGLWLGFNSPRWSDLVPIGIGVTAYGLAYALVHDVYIHDRVGVIGRFGGRRSALLDRLARAHGLHHRFGGAPYGMLVPIVPASVRERASRRAQRIAAVPRP